MDSLSPWLKYILFCIASRIRFIGVLVNRAAINNAATRSKNRPHPFSTRDDYTSWASLTDKRWSGRQLPPKASTGHPPLDKVRALFACAPQDHRRCEKSTLLFPAFAQYLTDGFIRTVMEKKHLGGAYDDLAEDHRVPADDSFEVRRLNSSNHEIDLCQLYGRTPSQTRQLRLLSDQSGQRGLLKSEMHSRDGNLVEEYAPSLFAADGKVKPEFDKLDLPKGLTNFEKNVPARVYKKRLASIFAFGGDRANAVPQVAMLNTLFLREHNRLASLIEIANPDWDDDRVFETARNTVIVLFIKITVEEYINHISPYNFSLRADPKVAWNARWNRPNWITVEFSLLYRWHSLIPPTTRWAQAEINSIDTTFDNSLMTKQGLAASFNDMAAQPSGRLGLNGMSDEKVLEWEMNAVQQGRQSDLAFYADYCEHVGVPRPREMSDITSDPALQKALTDVYGAPECVEFYAGIFAQDAEENTPIPTVILRMVAVDAFSQALTNPLLSEYVFNAQTFSDIGWEAIEATECLRDLVVRNVPETAYFDTKGKPAENAPEGVKSIADVVTKDAGMTQATWEYTPPPTPVITPVGEALSLYVKPEGRKALIGFLISTIGECVGLILWLYYWLQGDYWTGLIWLVLGEACEYLLLAVAIAKHPNSYPRKKGKVRPAIVKGALVAFSESLLWIAWLWLIPKVGLPVATLQLLIAMHVKHVLEMQVFTGKGFVYHFKDGQDLTASLFEVAGAAGFYYYWVTQGQEWIGAAVLIFAISIEHILQFKSAGLAQATPPKPSTPKAADSQNPQQQATGA